jgi:hypothetical protein
MALPLVHADRQRVVDPQSPLTSGRVTIAGGWVDVLGRAIAIGFGVGILLITGSGAASLAVIGVLAIGSALVSWSE